MGGVENDAAGWRDVDAWWGGEGLISLSDPPHAPLTCKHESFSCVWHPIRTPPRAMLLAQCGDREAPTEKPTPASAFGASRSLSGAQRDGSLRGLSRPRVGHGPASPGNYKRVASGKCLVLSDERFGARDGGRRARGEWQLQINV